MEICDLEKRKGQLMQGRSESADREKKYQRYLEMKEEEKRQKEELKVWAAALLVLVLLLLLLLLLLVWGGIGCIRYFIMVIIIVSLPDIG